MSGAGTVGSKLDYAACRGGPNEQWEINANGTITTIQVGLCISQSGTGLELAKCTTAASEKWTYTSEAPPSANAGGRFETAAVDRQAGRQMTAS